MDERYQRHDGLFGAEGQARLAACRPAIVGLGGLGSHMAQQLAYLGVERPAFVDHDLADVTSLNRLIGATPADHGRLKVDIASDHYRNVLPTSEPVVHPHPLDHDRVQTTLSESDVILACLDDDLARLQLLDRAATARIPLFDLATDVVAVPGQPIAYGGRVLYSGRGDRCAHCMGLLDQNAIRRAGMNDAQLEAEAKIYGVSVSDLRPATGPSVVSLNGVIASLAVMELVKLVTGLGEPSSQVRYVGERGIVRLVMDPPSIVPCPYCSTWQTGSNIDAA